MRVCLCQAAMQIDLEIRKPASLPYGVSIATVKVLYQIKVFEIIFFQILKP